MSWSSLTRRIFLMDLLEMDLDLPNDPTVNVLVFIFFVLLVVSYALFIFCILLVVSCTLSGERNLRIQIYSPPTD